MVEAGGKSVASSEEPEEGHAEKRDDDRHDESTDAEGGLESETQELNAQAQRSRSPEEGEDVLGR